jgi:hypothetical protein
VLPGDVIPVLKDWILRPIECEQIDNWVKGLSVFIHDTPRLSIGTSCEYHIDTTDPYGYYHLAHRVVIPLTDNFIWEWQLNNNVIETVKPVIGNIYLFNNMIMHRFICEEKRATIVFDMYDKNLKDRMLEIRATGY